MRDLTPGYRVITATCRPIMRWSRLTARGLDCLPATGPVLLVSDHDSYWDPIAIAVATREVRQIHALAKSTLWKTRPVAALMTEMGHIPVHRDASNEAALGAAIEALRAGACIGLFPEGTRSLGRVLRARSGVGRLAAAVPQAQIVCVQVNGSVDVVRLPKRPRITVEFFRPAAGPQSGESPGEFAARLVVELRAGAPREVAGRRRKAAKHRRAARLPLGAQAAGLQVEVPLDDET